MPSWILDLMITHHKAAKPTCSNCALMNTCRAYHDRLSVRQQGTCCSTARRWGACARGGYGGEPVLDYLENKATKAVYITAQHIVYVNLGRQSVRWALSPAPPVLCHHCR